MKNVLNTVTEVKVIGILCACLQIIIINAYIQISAKLIMFVQSCAGCNYPQNFIYQSFLPASS